MKKAKTKTSPTAAADRRVNRLLAAAQKREDNARASTERQLIYGLKRALPHMWDSEISAIEPIIHQVLGRAQLSII